MRYWHFLAIPVLLAVGTLTGLSHGVWAQDGSTGGTPPDTVTPPNIETGASTVYYADAPINLGSDYGYDGSSFDLTPVEGKSLENAARVPSALYFRQVVSYYFFEVKDTSGAVQKRCRFGTVPTAIDAADVWRVEEDSDIRFFTRQMSRLYLRSGGYVLAMGRAGGRDGLIRRWMSARGLALMPAEANSPPEGN